MKYTAEEVRKSADWLYQWERKAGARNARAMLTAYAERIEADEGAVAIWQYRRTSDAQWLDCDELDADAWKQTGLHEVRKVFTHPPAQAAQVDLQKVFDALHRSSPLPEIIRHVPGAERLHHEAHAMVRDALAAAPTADPVAQGEPVAGIQVPREGLPRVAQFIPYPAWLRLPPGIHGLFTAPPAQPAERGVRELATEVIEAINDGDAQSARNAAQAALDKFAHQEKDRD